MENVYRLKPVNWIAEIGLPVLFLSVLVVLIWITAGESFMQNALAIIFMTAALLHLLFLLRLGNPIYLIPAGFYASGALTFLSLRMEHHTITFILTLFSFFFFLLFMWVLVKRKMKWRYREVLELAARSVRSVEDGYTSRPLPAGTLQADQGNWDGFARFLRKYAVAWPLKEGEALVLVIPDNLLSYISGLKHGYRDATYIMLDSDKQLSVKISEKAYDHYEQELTFDQLCRALGNLLTEFHEKWTRGEKQKIIRIMDDLKLIS